MHFRDAYDPFRALGGTWNLVPRAPATLIVGALALFLADSSSGGFSWGEGQPFAGSFLPAFASGYCCLGLLFWLLVGQLHIGLAAAVKAAARGDRERFGILIEARERFLSMLLARLGKLLAWLVFSLPFGVMVGGPIALGAAMHFEELGIALGILGGLVYLPLWAWLMLGLTFVEEAVAFEGRDPVAALKRSFELVRGHRIQLLLYGLVLFVLTFAGFCLCLIGVLCTGPWARLAWFESFQRLSEPSAANSEP